MGSFFRRAASRNEDRVSTSSGSSFRGSTPLLRFLLLSSGLWLLFSCLFLIVSGSGRPTVYHGVLGDCEWLWFVAIRCSYGKAIVRGLRFRVYPGFSLLSGVGIFFTSNGCMFMRVFDRVEDPYSCGKESISSFAIDVWYRLKGGRGASTRLLRTGIYLAIFVFRGARVGRFVSRFVYSFGNVFFSCSSGGRGSLTCLTSCFAVGYRF